MNMKFLVLLLLIGSSLMLPAAPVKPVIIAQKGKPTVTADGTSAVIETRQALSAGSVIETDKNSKVAIAVAPGQMVSLGSKGKLKIISIHDASIDKGAVVEVMLGSASCYIDPKHGHSGPVFELVAGKETIKAKGTTWTTSVSASGTVSTTVTSSAVTITTASGVSIPAAAGSVVTSSAAGVVIVNLVTGTVTTVAADGGTSTGTASATQLSSAAASFQAAVNAAVTSPSGAEAAAVVALVASVNATLSAAGLPTVSAGGGTSTGAAIDTGAAARDTATSNNNTVSPERP